MAAPSPACIEAKPLGGAATMCFKAVHGLGASSALATPGARRPVDMSAAIDARATIPAADDRAIDATAIAAPRIFVFMWALSCLRIIFFSPASQLSSEPRTAIQRSLHARKASVCAPAYATFTELC